MKVKYEYDLNNDENNDKFNLKLNENSWHMYQSLSDLQDYIRQLNKGWILDDKDKMIDTIQDILAESGIHNIE